MSMSKHTKLVNVQTPATRAAGKLASFANKPPTTAESPVTPEEPAAVVLAMDQLSAEFAKQRAALKTDVSTLIQDAIKPIQDSLDSLQTTMTSFQKRLTSVESVAGDNFERLTVAESAIKTLQSRNQSLLDQCDDLENRSRRSNLRILNIPEGSEDGKDPVKFISDVLMEVMGPVFTVKSLWTRLARYGSLSGHDPYLLSDGHGIEGREESGVTAKATPEANASWGS